VAGHGPSKWSRSSEEETAGAEPVNS
jgi:hypothetical protein